MKKRVSLKIIIPAIIVLLIFLIYFFVFNFSGNITSSHFEVFSDEIQSKEGFAGLITNNFAMSDIVGLYGKSDVNKFVILNYEIFDLYGNKVDLENKKSAIISSGEFELCCITLPQKTGFYIMKLFLNGKESRSLLFNIVS